MPINPTEIVNEIVTDYQMQPFLDQDRLPVGAVATVNELVIVLGNGRTIKIVGVKLLNGNPRLVARLQKQAAVEDMDSIT